MRRRMLQFIGGYWIAEFQRGRKSIEDQHRFGRLVDMCTDESVQRVNDQMIKWSNIVEKL